MKKEVDVIDAVPNKRLFLSIIADYDLNRSICELVDNALDIWVRGGGNNQVEIKIKLDKDQQTIYVTDNAGGVAKSELSVMISPGQTGNLPEERIIGIFGVGTKRAVVALSQDVTITTRRKNEKTYQIEFDEAWIQDERWELPVYEVDSIAKDTTTIKLQRLRFQINEDVISQLKEHLRATYARFLKKSKVTIEVNSDKLKPLMFEEWAYPPKYPPRKYIGSIKSEDNGTVKVEVLAGLTKVSSPTGGEYGVYFYCNDRLITRGLKSYDVGFTRGLAGNPHPSISLTRVIVSLSGPVKLMPWNSSKSAIYPNHPTFVSLRNSIIQIVTHYASLSRRWEGQWPEEVFGHISGKIKRVKIEDFPEARRLYLPPLPQARPRYGDIMKQKNKKIAKDKPWATGLYESIVAIDLIYKQRLTEKNRICLILLDSTLEIAFKEYLVNGSGHYYSDSQLLALFKNRNDVEEEIKQYIHIPKKLWRKIDHYYTIRCKLVHERATVGISDEQVENYREVVEKVLKKLFGLAF